MSGTNTAGSVGGEPPAAGQPLRIMSGAVDAEELAALLAVLAARARARPGPGPGRGDARRAGGWARPGRTCTYTDPRGWCHAGR